MEWLNIGRYALIGVAVSFVMLYINKAASKPVAENAEGQRVLEVNKLYLVIGWLGIAMGVGSLLLMVFMWEPGIEVPAIISTLLFGGSGYMMLLYYRNHKVVFDEERVTVIGWTGKRFSVKWAEINDIKFNSLSGYIKLYGLGEKANIHFQIMGIKSFLDMMEAKTNWRAKDLRIPFR